MALIAQLKQRMNDKLKQWQDELDGYTAFDDGKDIRYAHEKSALNGKIIGMMEAMKLVGVELET